MKSRSWEGEGEEAFSLTWIFGRRSRRRSKWRAIRPRLGVFRGPLIAAITVIIDLLRGYVDTLVVAAGSIVFHFRYNGTSSDCRWSVDKISFIIHVVKMKGIILCRGFWIVLYLWYILVVSLYKLMIYWWLTSAVYVFKIKFLYYIVAHFCLVHYLFLSFLS